MLYDVQISAYYVRNKDFLLTSYVQAIFDYMVPARGLQCGR